MPDNEMLPFVTAANDPPAVPPVADGFTLVDIELPTAKATSVMLPPAPPEPLALKPLEAITPKEILPAVVSANIVPPEVEPFALRVMTLFEPPPGSLAVET